MYKKVVLEKGYNYTNTTVPLYRSIDQIKEMLRKHGCSRIGEMSEFDTEGNQQLTLVFEHLGIPYMIHFPITYVKTKNQPERLNMNVSGRVIHDRVKSLLISVDIDYLSFSQAMMPFLALRSEAGEMIPLEDKVVENMEQIEQGSFDLRLCLPGSR